jgi:hypothetical protein
MYVIITAAYFDQAGLVLLFAVRLGDLLKW